MATIKVANQDTLEEVLAQTQANADSIAGIPGAVKSVQRGYGKYTFTKTVINNLYYFLATINISEVDPEKSFVIVSSDYIGFWSMTSTTIVIQDTYTSSSSSSSTNSFGWQVIELY